MRLRKATVKDAPALSALIAQAGFPERSAESLRWLFANPAQGTHSPGWALEGVNGLAGFIGNFVVGLRVNGAPATAASGHTYIALPEARGHGSRLLRAFLAQRGHAAFYTLNNNAGSASIYPATGAEPWLGERGRMTLEWPLDWPRLVSGAVTRRLCALPALEAVVERRERYARLRQPAIPAPDAADIRPLDPCSETDAVLLAAFAQRLAAEQAVSPDRSPEIWRFRLSDPDAAVKPVLWGWMHDGAVCALCALQVTKPSRAEAPVLDFTDLVSLRDYETRALPALTGAAARAARTQGAARLRLPVVSEQARRTLREAGAAARRRHAHCHVRFPPDAGGGLRDGWDPGAFEGDQFFALRKPPRPEPA